MATTTNYGWETPDDTDLVKDGALAIRTLGSAIDTTTKNLNPETTTGDISYRSSTANTNTRLALGTAGQVLTVNSGATAPEWQTPSAGGLSAASQAEMEAGSSTTVAVTPGRQQYHPSAAKGWIIFNGEGTISTLSSYNVTSITDNGTGLYTVTWNVDFSTANYSYAITSAKTTDAGVQSSTVMVGGSYGVFAGYIEVYTANVDGTAKDSPKINVIAYGDQ